MNLRSLLFILFATAAISSVQAASPEVDRLEATVNQALDAVYSAEAVDLSKAEKCDRVRAILEANYDLNVIIRRAIGRNWRNFNASQQETVLELVKQLVVKAYVDNMNGQARPEISFSDAMALSDKRMEIQSTVKTGERSVSVLYRLGLMQSGWEIYDVVGEGISVVSNYRQQIDDHFRRGNAADLIAKLEDLLDTDTLSEESLKL